MIHIACEQANEYVDPSHARNVEKKLTENWMELVLEIISIKTKKPRGLNC